MKAIYRVEHRTRYAYAATVAASQHVAYLRPRELPYQRVHSHHLLVEPEPVGAVQRSDYFGNVADHFQILRPHLELMVTAQSVVEVHDRADELDVPSSPPWEEARRALTERGNIIAPDISQFALPSPYVVAVPEVEAFARVSFPRGQTLLGGALDLMHRIHSEFSFDPAAATSLTRPMAQVLEERRGVCQDFAHFQVSCLRSIGLAARYVSGYLLTDPPPNQPRLIGADASHAWIAVYCPRFGWVDFDPTNDVVVRERHVTLAWGRDYGDVSPLRGVLLGGAEHTVYVGVSVIPLEGVESAP
jgi:transglutaminase-like putative cysteine protease